MSSEDKDNKKNKVLPKEKSEKPKKEIGGQEGPEPTRYGDWEKKGLLQIFKKLLICNHLFIRLSMRLSTTAGSAKVDVSPRLLYSFSAIFLKIRLMIFPDRVLGSPGAH